ncbi:MAG: segregation and condensation protein A [Bryobacteraceae bacterium]
MSTSPLNFHLDSYEGPLDLLLDLIRRQEINIYDIPIAGITAQYLEYMQHAAELNIELGAEFIYMAATLIHIKSKMLLPRDPELDKMSPEDDPRRELVDRLLEHEKYKNAAEMLQQKRMLEEAMWSNPGIGEFATGQEEGELAVTLFDLIRTLQTVLDRARNRPLYEVGREDVTVPRMIVMLRDRLAAIDAHDSIPALAMFEAQGSRRAVICLFLAILEMVRMQALVLVQKEAFGEIVLRRHKRFEEVAAGEEMTAAIREKQSENVGTA